MNPRMARGLAVVDWGVSVIPFAGERESGDDCVVRPFAKGTLIAVADGAGHGAGAAYAARLAIATVRSLAETDPTVLMRQCHRALQRTRGAAISVARFEHGKLTWLGVGNVAGVLLRHGGRAEPLLVRAGAIGYRLPALHASVAQVHPGDMLAIATDGIGAGFVDDLAAEFSSGAAPQLIAERIAARHAKSNDDGLALVARYMGWE